MKGVVMERDNKNVIVMTDDGQFLDLIRPNNTLEVGQEIVINSKQNPTIRRIASIAAAFILFITSSYAVYGYYTPYGYVNVDINPSVEISYNLYDRVIGLEGLNEDGELVVEKMGNYKNKPIDVVINQVVDKAVEEAYIKPEKENTILVTVVEKEKKVDDQKIYNAVEHHVDEIKAEAELVVIETKEDVRGISEQKNITPGKAALIQKAVENDKDIDIEELMQKPVDEIVRMIQKQRNEERKEDKQEEEKEKKRKESEEKKEKDEEKVEDAFKNRKNKNRTNTDKIKREKEIREQIEENEKIRQEQRKKIKERQTDIRERINKAKEQQKENVDKWEQNRKIEEKIQEKIQEDLDLDRYKDLKEKLEEEFDMDKYKDLRKKWDKKKGKNN